MLLDKKLVCFPFSYCQLSLLSSPRQHLQQTTHQHSLEPSARGRNAAVASEFTYSGTVDNSLWSNVAIATCCHLAIPVGQGKLVKWEAAASITGFSVVIVEKWAALRGGHYTLYGTLIIAEQVCLKHCLH